MKSSLALALLLLAGACGGQVTSSGDGGSPSGSSSGGTPSGSGGSSGSPGTSSGGSGSSSGTGVSSSSGTVAPCPDFPPAIGDACTDPGAQGCVYFTGGTCKSFLCGSDSTWQSTTEGC